MDVEELSERRRGARERMLSAADELFYDQGVHHVGVDRIVERAAVSKKTLYEEFGSKDGLVAAYLDARHARWRDRLTREIAARWDTPRDRMLGVFDVLGEQFPSPDFRGCAFVNASAEAPLDSQVVRASDDSRTWKRAVFADLAREAGVASPDLLAVQLVQLYDGAQISARLDRNLEAGREARAAAAELVEAALAGGGATAEPGPRDTPSG